MKVLLNISFLLIFLISGCSSPEVTPTSTPFDRTTYLKLANESVKKHLDTECYKKGGDTECEKNLRLALGEWDKVLHPPELNNLHSEVANCLKYAAKGRQLSSEYDLLTASGKANSTVEADLVFAGNERVKFCLNAEKMILQELRK